MVMDQKIRMIDDVDILCWNITSAGGYSSLNIGESSLIDIFL